MIGLIGLGIMGSAMSTHLLDRGFEVVGHDVEAERTAALEARGGLVAASPAAVARQAGIVLTSLPSSRALLDVVAGPDGLRDAGRPDLVVVDTSTLALEHKQAAHDLLAEVGSTLLDCTISGTGAQAATRDIAVYGSGDQDAFARARPVLDAIARSVHHLGEFGLGSRMKFLANHLVAIHTLATAEALLLATRSGMDLDQVQAVIADGAGTSRMFEVRGPLMAAGRYEPPMATLETLDKDLGIIDDFARDVGAPTPLLSAVRPYYTAALSQGRAGQDAAALFAVLQQLVHVVPGDGRAGG